MSDLFLEPALAIAPAAHRLGALRTLLVGRFAEPERCDRQTLEALLAVSPDTPVPGMRFGSAALDPVEQAETQLARDAVDVVLLDLDGPVGAVLSMVGRLRAAAGAGVVFIGLMPWRTKGVARLYLSAVVDEVIDEPLRPGSVHRIVAEALRVAPSAPGIFFCPPRSIGSPTRH